MTFADLIKQIQGMFSQGPGGFAQSQPMDPGTGPFKNGMAPSDQINMPSTMAMPPTAASPASAGLPSLATGNSPASSIGALGGAGLGALFGGGAGAGIGSQVGAAAGSILSPHASSGPTPSPMMPQRNIPNMSAPPAAASASPSSLPSVGGGSPSMAALIKALMSMRGEQGM